MERAATCQDASRAVREDRAARPPEGTTKVTVTTMTTTVTTHGDAAVVASRAPRILLYSDDVAVREQVRLAVGRRLRAGAPEIDAGTPLPPETIPLPAPRPAPASTGERPAAFVAAG